MSGPTATTAKPSSGDLPDPRRPCPETLGSGGHGQVREYDFDWSSGKATGWRVFASGLRNSLGLAQHPGSKVILQVENARDDIDQVMTGLENDEDLPPDEINWLVAGRNYGWPYCYGARLASPEYAGWDCGPSEPPQTALPAHAAPLGLAWWQDGLIVGFHGYRSHGHRLVRFPVDGQGLPNGPLQDLVFGWELAGRRPGRPPGRAGWGALYLGGPQRHGAAPDQGIRRRQAAQEMRRPAGMYARRLGSRSGPVGTVG